MNPDPILSKALRLLHRKRYDEVIRLLEPEVVRFHDSFIYYTILAQACLRSADFGGALTYFRRAREIRMRDPCVSMGLAVLHLRRGETDKAIEYYLDILDKQPSNKVATRALKILKKQGDPEALALWMERGQLPRLYPPLPRQTASFPRALAITAICFIVAAGVTGLVLHEKAPETLIRSGHQRAGLSDTQLLAAEKAEPVEVGGSYRYVLTRSEILSGYEKARDLFLDFRDEAAKVEINRLLASNASGGIKAKAKLLASFTVVPGFDTLKDRYGFTAVQNDPALYQGCHIVWKGMAANVRSEDTSTSFDLLVGYDTRSSLEGIVPVTLPFAITIDMERPLEVLARVELSKSGGGNDLLRLEGIALHQSPGLTRK